MQQDNERYSLNALAIKTGYSSKLLRKWRNKGWLVPIGTTGVQLRYNIEGLKKAEAISLSKIVLDKAKVTGVINWNTAIV